MAIKTVNNEGLNPYSQYPLIQEKSEIYLGKEVTLKMYSKNYGAIERIKKCFVAFLLTALTGGLLLIKESFRKEWGRVLDGCSLKRVRISKDEVKIDQETLEKAKKFVLENVGLISNRLSDEQINFYMGKHCTVFSHVNFPGIILKIMTKDQAEDSFKNIEMARTLVKDHSLDSCYIPKAQIIELSNKKTLFVMEKAPGIINTGTSKMVSECEYELFDQNPEIKAKWKKYFTQAAELIARLGYWDTSWSNILPDKDRGFSFIDFENTEPSIQNIKTGIERLLGMAPPDFFEEIASIARTFGVDIEISKPQLERKAELDMNAHIRKWHKTHAVTKDSGIVNVNSIYKDPIAEIIVNKLTEQLKNNFSEKYFGENLVERRELYWQPLFYDVKASQDQFEKVLEELRDRNILCTWTAEKNLYDKNLTVFKIYF